MLSLKLLLQKSRLFTIAVFVLGVINFSLSLAILAFINSSITRRNIFEPRYDFILFILLILLSFFVNKIFQVYIIKLTADLTFELEVDLLTKLKGVNLSELEKIGTHRVHTAMDDIVTLTILPEMIMKAINSIIIVCGGIIFLLWTSLLGGIAIITLMGLLLSYYLLKNREIKKRMMLLRSTYDTFAQYLNDLLLGFKEVRASTSKTENIYHKFLVANRVAGKKILLETKLKYLTNELLGNYSWYVVILVLLFVVPRTFSVDWEQVVMFLIAILYMQGSIGALIELFSTFNKVKIATERIDDFGLSISSSASIDVIPSRPTPVIEKKEEFKILEVKSLFYQHGSHGKGGSFAFGPIDLEVKKGEVLFIQGKNGSGKSTLVNLLSGVYKPMGGTISINGEEISSKGCRNYSKHFAVIFASPYMLSENYEDYSLVEMEQDVNDYVRLMRLEKKLVRNQHKGTFEAELSLGQQKRLALIYALLENKGLLILDEWASQQDPEFKKYFYEDIIPHLKKLGKTIIAITHDDAYFDCADRIVKLDSGKIVSDNRMQPSRVAG